MYFTRRLASTHPSPSHKHRPLSLSSPSSLRLHPPSQGRHNLTSSLSPYFYVSTFPLVQRPAPRPPPPSHLEYLWSNDIHHSTWVMQGRVLELERNLEHAAVCGCKDCQQLLHQQLEGACSTTASQTCLTPKSRCCCYCHNCCCYCCCHRCPFDAEYDVGEGTICCH